MIDVTVFVRYFIENVYNKLGDYEISPDVFEKFRLYKADGKFTEKESALWQFVISKYGTEPFSTKQIEKDYGDVAYATVRSFVLKFEELGFLTSTHYGNRVKYKVTEINKF